MSTTVIYVHPYDKSFNHAILEVVSKSLSSNKVDFNVIDLYQDHFDPSYSTEELKKFSSGETIDPLVKKYQQVLKNSDQLIFIFPIWWNDLPGILKGFIDKVFKANFAYVDGPRGVKGLLTNIKKVSIFTTSKAPNWYLKIFAGNSIKSVFIKATLKQVGIKNVKWVNYGQINVKDNQTRVSFLKNINV